MKILREGEHGIALDPRLGRVPILYTYRDLTLDSGVEVKNVLVGVHEATDEVLVVPAQSTPRITEARHAAKDEVLEARVPHELEDVLALISERFGASQKKFGPALVRFYLHSAVEEPALATRLDRLSRRRLAMGKAPGRIRVRCDARLMASLGELAARYDEANQSDFVRGAIVAAKEDVLDGKAGRRVRQLEAVAAAV